MRLNAGSVECCICICNSTGRLRASQGVTANATEPYLPPKKKKARMNRSSAGLMGLMGLILGRLRSGYQYLPSIYLLAYRL